MACRWGPSAWVCNPLTRTLPDLALRASRPDGRTDVVTLLRAVLRRPDKLPELLQIVLDARSARATLLQCCRVLSPDPGLTGTGRLSALGTLQPGLRPAVA
jgi:hypothetical protein